MSCSCSCRGARSKERRTLWRHHYDAMLFSAQQLLITRWAWQGVRTVRLRCTLDVPSSKTPTLNLRLNRTPFRGGSTFGFCDDHRRFALLRPSSQAHVSPEACVEYAIDIMESASGITARVLFVWGYIISTERIHSVGHSEIVHAKRIELDRKQQPLIGSSQRRSSFSWNESTTNAPTSRTHKAIICMQWR